MMPFSRPILDAQTKIDFYAGSQSAFNNLLPVWEALPKERKGTFYAWQEMKEVQTVTFSNYLSGLNPLVITNPSDLSYVFYAGEERAFILVEFEHHKQTRGLLAAVSLFLCNNEKDLSIRKAYADKYQAVSMFTSPSSIAAEIIKFIIGISPKHTEMMNGETVGLIYMAFGVKAANAVKRSVATLKRIGFSYPVTIVGDTPVEGFNFIPWEGESPFDITQKKNFQFRAGRIKPFLCRLSPYDRTLYLDADTEFLQDIRAGFEYLDSYDIALTQEYLTVGELYNKFQAGWEINIEERAQTIKEGISPEEKFINSGVIFFRSCEENDFLFKRWHEQWMRFQQWDEQLALMRAIYHSGSDAKYLTPEWNDPHVHDNTIIFHNYGRGNVRESK